MVVCMCLLCMQVYLCMYSMYVRLNMYIYDKVTFQHSCRFSARCHISYEINLTELLIINIINIWSGGARRDCDLHFISTNNAQCLWNMSVGSMDPTYLFQKHIQKTIHKYTTIIDKNQH